MSNQVAIKVENVSKNFRLPHEKNNSIKGMVVNLGRGRTYEKQKALEEVSFEVGKGEFFGIVGRNGGGKSTLLKLLAGIYSPSRGAIHVSGKLTPFIELGVGFNPELTGRENVFLNGALLGFNRKEMAARYGEIVAFAELERFMDQKLKNYSSGMQVRLAFSIAIQARTEILLLDEVLAVGDAAFQQKCFDYFEILKREGKTIVFVSHDMNAIRRFCTKAILIEDGRIKQAGTPDEIAGQYLLDNISDEQPGKKVNKSLSEEVKELDVKLRGDRKLSRSGTLKFDISYVLPKHLEIDLGFSIINNGFSVAEQNTKDMKLPATKGKTHIVSCEVPLGNFNPSAYRIDVAVFTKSGFKLIGYVLGAEQFVVDGADGLRGGPVRVEGKWSVR
ncbi:MAG TPA: polysaccharide ABC transporter ATP-binding protein [Verrucomicrobiae bacterium]|nr:polysaccharide ABC transporter ATP-binding protein [Verrucomicrobiae bacterium]